MSSFHKNIKKKKKLPFFFTIFAPIIICPKRATHAKLHKIILR